MATPNASAEAVTTLVSVPSAAAVPAPKSGARRSARAVSECRARRDIAWVVRLAGEDPLHQRFEMRQRGARVVRVERALVPRFAEMHAGVIPGVAAQPLARAAVPTQVM